MENFRSKSYRDGPDSSSHGTNKNKVDPTTMQELRSYSLNTYGGGRPAAQLDKELKIKNNNNNNNKGNKLQGSSSARGWSFSDPELQRKKRVAGYKAYSVEGKMKGSFRKSFRWVKETYSQVVYGWK